jgi:hypothetical protein
MSVINPEPPWPPEDPPVPPDPPDPTDPNVEPPLTPGIQYRPGDVTHDAREYA